MAISFWDCSAEGGNKGVYGYQLSGRGSNPKYTNKKHEPPESRQAWMIVSPVIRFGGKKGEESSAGVFFEGRQTTDSVIFWFFSKKS